MSDGLRHPSDGTWEPGRYELSHKACGTVILLYDHQPMAGEQLRSFHAAYPDGLSRPRPGEMIWCSYCGRSVRTDEITF